ncbi:MAG: hypothetical protein V2I26_08020 [Halieaceae bacterium]|jgi:hypothetical protein|nr:hypothetical protein [Halieaceae bacterium]
MKSLLPSLLVVVICGAATALQAGEDKALYLARCTEQLSQQFGPDADIKLVSLRRAGAAMRVKVAVRLRPSGDGTEKVRFETCVVSRAAPPGSNTGGGASLPSGATREAAGEEL